MGRTSDAKERLMSAIMELIWTGSYGSTTIDQICERAGVKKGSFYYFFESKAALAVVAIEQGWQEFRGNYDRIFSPTVPPLQRLHDYCEFCYEEQVELKRKYGHVLGCPLCTLGAEVSTQEAILRAKVEDVMNQSRKYLETAVRDAAAAGLIRAADAPAKARCLYAYIEGLLTQSRIQNDVEVLREMERGVLDVLGVRQETGVAA
jgi:TetR/AcrR family transcriptional regulator, transcriptional repressor for nem operon